MTHFLPQVAETLTLQFILTLPTCQVPLWSVHLFSHDTPAPLTMVQTHPTPTWSTGTPPQPWVEWLPSHSLRGSVKTLPTTILRLQKAAPSAWECEEGFKQVRKWKKFGTQNSCSIHSWYKSLRSDLSAETRQDLSSICNPDIFFLLWWQCICATYR